MAENSDTRPRGMLTKEDRKYLRGEKEYEHETSELHRRADIRERVRNGILDFTLLWNEWEKDEMWKLRDSDRPPALDEDFEDRELENGLRDMIALALFLADAEPLFHGAPKHGQLPVEQFLLSLFRQLGAEYSHYVRDYDLEFDDELVDVYQIANRLEDGKDVPMHELAAAIELNLFENVDSEAVKEMVQEEVRKQAFDEGEDATEE